MCLPRYSTASVQWKKTMEEDYCRCPGCGECGGAENARELWGELNGPNGVKNRAGKAAEAGANALGNAKDLADFALIAWEAVNALAALGAE